MSEYPHRVWDGYLPGRSCFPGQHDGLSETQSVQSGTSASSILCCNRRELSSRSGEPRPASSIKPSHSPSPLSAPLPLFTPDIASDHCEAGPSGIEAFSSTAPRVSFQAMLKDRDALLRQLHELRSEHRDLDTVISRLADQGALDQLQLQRLKKRKLLIKDEVSRLESNLIPDNIA
ncbi:putative cytosolic protein [Granulibacter bethesdensis]|uniref:Cytosolic protein n=2 Tax=Granulibacter bethesdensis TaxID=364410 RepID=Q0BSE1_GRABC|nr:putative cytosolic protein [Granulibacter bethesdensis CGDNIH1]AHJ68830.1 putative cytosolic protein [Granulibacter bethesdensis]APH52087.1 putative cytosolic protein [Granulibacter bethesdensis]APH64778.1 putative cytosolic protein [Granulibacter bethesdensis]